MTKISIQDQKNLLKEFLVIETLTSDNNNRDAVTSFCASKKGKGLELYLKKYAWEEDMEGNTKVYLVKDKRTNVIVFFFALSAGLLYKELGNRDYELSELESDIVDVCVQYKLDPENEYTVDDVFGWYEDENLDKEKLRRIILEEAAIKLAAKDDINKTDEDLRIKRVAQTYPGIVLTHFCKNVNSQINQDLSFPLGFYVFWEIVVNKILEIARLIGCQYLYLFAADSSDISYNTRSLQGIIYDLDEEETSPTYELVEYYKNELKFEAVDKLAVLKPHYDFKCFSLYQPVDKLLYNRSAAWIQHSDIDE